MTTEGAPGHLHSNVAYIVAIQRQVSLEPCAQDSQVYLFLIAQLPLMLMMEPFSIPCTSTSSVLSVHSLRACCSPA